MADIRDQCGAGGVPFFFKQWGGVFKKRNGRLLEGRMWDEMPDFGAAAAFESHGLSLDLLNRKTCCVK